MTALAIAAAPSVTDVARLNARRFDCRFIGVNGGGVCLSLRSLLIGNLFGDNALLLQFRVTRCLHLRVLCLRLILF